MFGSFIPLPIERKPSEQWFFNDNLITGITASKGYEGSYDGVILPYGLSDDQRDLILWAYEAGFIHGRHSGELDIRTKFKRLMNLDGYA